MLAIIQALTFLFSFHKTSQKNIQHKPILSALFLPEGKEGNILKREREKGKGRRGESEREKGGKEGKRERTGRHVW